MQTPALLMLGVLLLLAIKFTFPLVTLSMCVWATSAHSLLPHLLVLLIVRGLRRTRLWVELEGT